jgi:amidase
MSKSKTTSQPQTPKIPAKWQLVSWQKKDEQYARIPQEWRLSSLPSSGVTNYIDIPQRCGILSAQELDITEKYDATALANAIKSRELKCLDVTRAFCKVCTLFLVANIHLIQSTESSNCPSTHKLSD